MDFVRKCQKCGFELTDASAKVCPVCGTSLVRRVGGNIWIGALIQFAISTVFLTVFHFPKFTIAIFGGMILIGALLSTFVKPKAAGRQVGQTKRPLSHPVLFRFVGVGILLCAFTVICCLLFGLVIFLNSWNRWHQYEGQVYHRSEFQVLQVYYQKQSKSHSFYARGLVEGSREWMSLQPYTHVTPHSQGEADQLVPAGTMIPIYFFPDLKGRARVQVHQDVPPAEASHRDAMRAANFSLLGLAVSGGLLFVLLKIQRGCYADGDSRVTPSVGMQIG